MREVCRKRLDLGGSAAGDGSIPKPATWTRRVFERRYTLELFPVFGPRRTSRGFAGVDPFEAPAQDTDLAERLEAAGCFGMPRMV